MNFDAASPSFQEPLSITPPTRSSGASDVVELEARIERLLIITESLWTILKEKHGLDEQELLRQMVQIDMRDGKLDGRVPPTPPQPCPKCNRMLNRRNVRCMFCGEPIAINPFAR